MALERFYASVHGHHCRSAVPLKYATHVLNRGILSAVRFQAAFETVLCDIHQ